MEAGIDARVGMAPILPGLSDRPELLAEVVREAREAGATGIWANLLYLRPGTRGCTAAAPISRAVRPIRCGNASALWRAATVFGTGAECASSPSLRRNSWK